MKKFNKKSLVLLVCVTLLLTFTVSGTVAFLADNSGPVTNVFTPTQVEITVTDEVVNGAKQNVVIHNKSTIPVYIRVAVVANWYKDGSIVAPWNDHADIPTVLADGWSYNAADGYYYYTGAVQPTVTSLPFFDAGKSYKPNTTVDGAHLEMDIIVQAIQADGMGVNNAVDAFAKAAN